MRVLHKNEADMQVMTTGDIGAKRIELEQEIKRLKREVAQKQDELKKLQKNCPHPDLVIIRSLRNNVNFCNVCGFEQRFTDLDNRDERISRKLNG